VLGDGALEALGCPVVSQEQAVAHRPAGEGVVDRHRHLGPQHGAVLACLLGGHDDLTVEGRADPQPVDGQQRQIEGHEAAGHLIELGDPQGVGAEEGPLCSRPG
jgi:hypothetical protein